MAMVVPVVPVDPAGRVAVVLTGLMEALGLVLRVVVSTVPMAAPGGRAVRVVRVVRAVPRVDWRVGVAPTVMVVRGVWVVRVVVGVRVVRVVRVFRGRRRVVMGRLVGMVGMRVAGVSVVPVARGVVLEVVARVRVLMVVGVMVARVVRAGLAVLVVPGMTRPWMGMGVGAVMPVPVVMVARGVLGV